MKYLSSSLLLLCSLSTTVTMGCVDDESMYFDDDESGEVANGERQIEGEGIIAEKLYAVAAYENECTWSRRGDWMCPISGVRGRQFMKVGNVTGVNTAMRDSSVGYYPDIDRSDSAFEYWKSLGDFDSIFLHQTGTTNMYFSIVVSKDSGGRQVPNPHLAQGEDLVIKVQDNTNVGYLTVAALVAETGASTAGATATRIGLLRYGPLVAAGILILQGLDSTLQSFKRTPVPTSALRPKSFSRRPYPTPDPQEERCPDRWYPQKLGALTNERLIGQIIGNKLTAFDFQGNQIDPRSLDSLKMSYVVMGRQLIITGGYDSHGGLANNMPVTYAGELHLDGNANVLSWDNGSGTYMPFAYCHDMAVPPMPKALFVPAFLP